MKKTSIASIAKNLGISSGKISQVSGYQIDSRKIVPGNLFFAILGEKSDGHDFLKDVHCQGAVGAVVSKKYLGPDYGMELLRVEDVGESLRSLAKKSLLEGPPIQIVGITGSVGKTTTKDFVATLLEGKFRVGKTRESQNSKLTLPLTVLNRGEEIEVLVLEMGMSEPGDIARLVEIAPPDIALITKIGLAHAAFFPGGLLEITKGKREIFSHPKTRVAICDASFSITDSKSALFLEKNRIYEKGSFVYTLDLPFQIPHLLHNFLAAAAVVRAMGMEWEEIGKRVSKLQLPKMRFEQFEKEGIFFINDAYNANPESMKAALSSLSLYKGKKIAVLGAMKELGVFSEECHREIGVFAQKFVDHLLVLGEEAKPIIQGFKSGEYFGLDYASLALRLKEIATMGDVVLVKGSRSMNMEKIFSCFFGSSTI